MSDQNATVSGVAAGVPYVALPPAGWYDGREPAPLIIAWHLNDPPRRAAAMVSAAARVSAVMQLAEVVAANERRFGVSYPWSDASRAVAARLDFVARAGELAMRDPQPAILLVTGTEDDPAFPLQAQRLQH